jgi:hypothetical protein
MTLDIFKYLNALFNVGKDAGKLLLLTSYTLALLLQPLLQLDEGLLTLLPPVLHHLPLHLGVQPGQDVRDLGVEGGLDDVVAACSLLHQFVYRGA